jgi:hypothetical protein
MVRAEDKGTTYLCNFVNTYKIMTPHSSLKIRSIIVCSLQVVGLVWGYIIQQFSQTVYILGAGFVLAAIVSKHGHLWSHNSKFDIVTRLLRS